jgi:lipoprotein-anchoring transpeptidase ErfK/SrfK
MKSEPRLTVQQLLQYGIRLVEEDQSEAARPFFEKVLERDPSNIPALMWLAGLSETSSDSYAYIARALAIDPQNERAHAAIRWNHWREQGDKLRAAGFEPSGPAAAQRTAAPIHSTSIWLGVIAALIVFLGAFAAVYFGQPQPVSATAQQPAAQGAEVAQVLLNVTPPPLPTRTLPATAAPAPTEMPATTATLPPALLPTATATLPPTLLPTATALPTDTPEPPTATPELPTPLPLPTDAPISVINPTGSTTERWIDVNLSSQSLVAYEGDTPVYWVTVSTGLPGTPTVTGQYRIYVKYPAQTMSGPGYYLPDVPYVMYFYQGYGIHGTYWHNNFGHPMSHGCVNTPTPDAAWLYNWADVGTLVNVHY